MRIAINSSEKARPINTLEYNHGWTGLLETSDRDGVVEGVPAINMFSASDWLCDFQTCLKKLRRLIGTLLFSPVQLLIVLVALSITLSLRDCCWFWDAPLEAS